MSIEDTIRNEATLMRTELQELKRCQLQYFLASVGGTGLLFGLSDRFNDNPSIEAMVFLVPLIIIIPCWWTFFDKATTITRLSGYSRCFIEDQLQQPTPSYYIGYENALAVLRYTEDNMTSDDRMRYNLDPRVTLAETFKLLRFQTRHRYWIINWYTYFILSVLCTILPLFMGIHYNPLENNLSFLVYACFIVVAVSAWYTLEVIKQLTLGRYGFDNFRRLWGIVYANLNNNGNVSQE